MSHRTEGLIGLLIFRAYIIPIFQLLSLYHCTCTRLSFIHLYAPKVILIIIYFQNRWSHDSIVEPTYVLTGSPGHSTYNNFPKIVLFSSHILHDICLNKLFVIVIVIVKQLLMVNFVISF